MGRGGARAGGVEGDERKGMAGGRQERSGGLRGNVRPGEERSGTRMREYI